MEQRLFKVYLSMTVLDRAHNFELFEKLKQKKTKINIRIKHH